MIHIAGAGGLGCFLGHTLVRTPDGMRTIESLQPGDEVLSFDDRGELHTAKVLKLHVHTDQPVTRYQVWGGVTLDATPNHWVLNQYNAFVEIGTLGPDDCVVDENGHLRPIVDRTPLERGTVYNLTVQGHHTFIAGGIRVHNAGLGRGPIAGAGGGGKGGGGGYTPSEAADSLDSAQYATVLDLLSEGEIEGLKSVEDPSAEDYLSFGSVYLNNTPLQNKDASYNFNNVTIADFSRGNPLSVPALDKSALNNIENEVPVGVEVTKLTPVVRTVTNGVVNAVRVTITIPSLQRFTDKGDIVGTSVRLQIAVQANGGGYVTRIDDTITGRSGDQYQRDYIVDINTAAVPNAFPIDIKVTRITDDSTSAKLTDAFTWTSYTEITYAKLRYTNSAYIQLRVDAAQFNSIPSRSYLLRGIKVKIPTNASPVYNAAYGNTGRLQYAGVWNGTFGAAQWTRDPAWILWDLLTSTRYGFGEHILTDQEKQSFTGNASRLDKWAFYAASIYCNELVPDGFGGTEQRFACNVNIQTQEDAYKLINDLCSVFRAMAYWSTGAVTLNQDKPADPAYLFTLANVSEDGFSYQNSSRKTRPTVVVVSYLDIPSRNTAYEVVEDQEAIAKYGAVTTEIAAFACTSRGQARRLGEWLLYAENYENEVVAFTASIDAGVVVRPGQVIAIADPVKAGQRRGGRITAATATAITVDSTAGIGSGTQRTLSVVMPDGTVQTRSIASIAGNVITVSSSFTTAPNVNSVWIYESADIRTTTWRVLTVTEQEGAQYGVTAIAYDADKYAYIERGVALQGRDVTNLNEQPTPPTNLALSEALYEYQGQIRVKVLASWKPVLGISQYQVRWRKDQNNWTVVTVDGPDFQVLDTTPGVFDFQVYSISPALKFSADALTGSVSVVGKIAPPSDVVNLNFTADKDLGVLLTWDAIPDIDLAQYEIRRGESWGTATLITQIKATTYKLGYFDNGTYTYLVKALDTSGIYSANPATVAITIADPNTTTISSVVDGTSLILTWTQPAITTYAISYYLIAYGNSYATSTEITKAQGTSFTLPITWAGSRTFYVVPVDLVGRFADPPSSLTVTVSAPPAVAITALIEGTTATLSWTAVQGSLPTSSYEIRRGSTFSSATTLANVTATSYRTTADWSGAQTFWVVAKDTNNNYGTEASTILTIDVAAATALSSTFAGQHVVFSWPAVKGTLDTSLYLLKRGTLWGSAAVVASIKATAYTLRVDWSGSQKFWIAAVDVNGNEGAASDLDVSVVPPSVPALSQQVVDNNVLLRWNDCTQTLPIASYELRRGSSWASATVIGTKLGGFTTVFETSAGTYTYWLAGIDSAGNYGAPGSVTAIVSQPPDYVLQVNQNSTWNGTASNIYIDASGLPLVNVDTGETWESHFTSRSYTTPQDQITAGYSYYLMPSTTTAFYEEEIDYGTVLAGTKVSAALTSTAVVGSTTITPAIRVRGTTTTAATYSQTTTTITVTSNAHGLAADDYVYLDFTSGTAADGTYVVVTAATNTFTVTSSTSATTSGNVSWVKWTTYSGVSEVFATQFRYIRVRYDFSSSGNNDILQLLALNTRIDAKIRNDAGTDTANSGDTGGTTVTFNVAFMDVQSITVTPLATSGVVAVYDFVDSPNPTTFKVLLFDTSGTRVSGSFSWNARGV